MTDDQASDAPSNVFPDSQRHESLANAQPCAAEPGESALVDVAGTNGRTQDGNQKTKRRADIGRAERSRQAKTAKKRQKQDDWREFKRRKVNADGETITKESKNPFSKDEIAAEERRPKRKVAVMIGYAGTGYKGMQVNGDEATIERDLFQAFIGASAISKANADDPRKVSLARCARTDKGVHAAGNVISLKLIIEEADIVDKINAQLPEQIRVWGIQRTNNSFNCYQYCDSRWYEYLMPSYCLLPPHPQTFLGRKLTDLTKEHGAEAEFDARMEDVEDFWSKVEEEEIRPILAGLDPDVRAAVLEKVHVADTDPEQATTKPLPTSDEGRSEGNLIWSQPNEARDPAREEKPTSADKPFSTLEAGPSEIFSSLNDGSSSSGDLYQQSDKSVASESGRTSPMFGEVANPQAKGLVDEPGKEATQCRGNEAAAVSQDSRAAKSAPMSFKPKNRELNAVDFALRDIKAAYIAAKRRYRISGDRLRRLQSALDKYVGTNNFHNFTIQKSFSDPSAKRHIKSFVVNPKPIIIDDTEWLSLKVHGQSFMMHQIRKMVGMASLLVRCGTPLDRVEESYGNLKIAIPKAPGLGLLLERPVFENYNRRAKDSLGRPEIDFAQYDERLQAFKDKHIYKRLFEVEQRENTFHAFFNQIDQFKSNHFLWLSAGGVQAAQVSKDKTQEEVDRALGDEDEDPEGGEG